MAQLNMVEQRVMRKKDYDGIQSANNSDVGSFPLDHPLRVEYMDYFRNNVPVKDVKCYQISVFPETDSYRVAFCDYVRTIPFASVDPNSVMRLPLEDEYRQGFIHYMAETMKSEEDESNLMALLNQYVPHHPIRVKHAAIEKARWDRLIAASKTPEEEAARAARVAAETEKSSGKFETTEEVVLHYKNMSGIRSAHPCSVEELALDHPLRVEYMDYIRKNVSFEDVKPDEVHVFPETDPYRVAFCAYLRALPLIHMNFSQAELLPLDDEHRHSFVHFVAETIPTHVSTVYALREYPNDHPLRVRYAALLPQYEAEDESETTS